ncbi:MAG: hypothetical protein HOQ11_06630 [Gemmatimonadaceae bacterium]|nr:hypothetical protein [Gemmatimonadaceae bacterium]NUQ93034.1 hypothetical protein [Gemmatimonadaceae bacterium]NUS97064.1 hypothetical protein [Gemmatimonadaceae bacterium]
MRTTALLGCALALVGPSVGAQESATADSARLRERCQFASRALASGHPDPHRQWALNFIRLCPGDAGPVLAAQWEGGNAASPSPAELNDLVFSSQKIRDQRVFDAAAAVARSVSTPSSLRFGALQVLASYADSTVAVSLDDLEHPNTAASLRVSTDVFPTAGAVPLATDVRARALAIFASLAANEPDAGIRAAAQYLSRGFGVGRP